MTPEEEKRNVAFIERSLVNPEAAQWEACANVTHKNLINAGIRIRELEDDVRRQAAQIETLRGLLREADLEVWSEPRGEWICQFCVRNPCKPDCPLKAALEG